MLRIFRNSAAIIAATAALTGPVWAQAPATADATTAPVEQQAPAANATAPEAPAAEVQAGASTALPQAITDLGITEATVSDGRRGGKRIEGSLPGGAAFQGMLDGKGQLRMIRATDKASVLPDETISKLIPEAVRNTGIFSEFASVQGVAISERGLMLFGTDAKEEPVRAAFSSDGTLQRFGRGDIKGPGMGPHGKNHKKGDNHGGKRGRGSDRGDKLPDGQSRAPAQSSSLDDAAVQSILSDGGYTEVGAITRNGARVEVEAKNPEGEAVTVTVNPRGVVVRELAR